MDKPSLAEEVRLKVDIRESKVRELAAVTDILAKMFAYHMNDKPCYQLVEEWHVKLIADLTTGM